MSCLVMDPRFLLCALATLGVAALAQGAPPVPIEVRLQERLRAFRGVMGVYARQLDSGEEIRVDADRRFPTASTIKTAVMIEVFQQVADGRLRKDQRLTLTDAVKVGGSGVLTGFQAGAQLTIADLLHLMITVSDNTATNLLVDLVGTARVDERLAAYGLSNTLLFRATSRGRADVRPELEREFGLGMTTPAEMGRLMELIADGKAVSPQASAEMLAILDDQNVRHMIPRGLPGPEQGVEVANKTGEDDEKLPDASGVRRGVRADAAIVRGRGRLRYVVSLYARQVQDTRWTVDNEALVTGGDVARMIHDHFARRTD